MWANADDQGRLTGDPEEVKYAVCPNIDHITKKDVPDLLKEFVANKLILVYSNTESAAIQLLDWWDVHRPQWAWPSDYPPPEGWQDHLRYKRGAKEVVTFNWFSQVSSQVSNEAVSREDTISPQVKEELYPGELSGEPPGERSGETDEFTPLTTPGIERGNRKRKLKEETERGNSPECSGEQPIVSQVSEDSVSRESPSHSLTVSPVKIINRLTKCYEMGWGTIRAEEPEKIIPRPPDARITAQLRDLTKELSSAGGCPLEYIDQAFKEAAGQQKYHISYVRAVLLDWLGRARTRPKQVASAAEM